MYKFVSNVIFSLLLPGVIESTKRDSTVTLALDVVSYILKS